MEIRIWRESGGLAVRVPQNPVWNYMASNAEGRKNSALNTWRFHLRQEPLIRKMCLKIFGSDGLQCTELRDVVIDFALLPTHWANQADFYFCGRRVCWRTSPAVAVKLDEDTRILRGGFPPQGGQFGRAEILPYEGTKLITKAYIGHPDLDGEKLWDLNLLHGIDSEEEEEYEEEPEEEEVAEA